MEFFKKKRISTDYVMILLCLAFANSYYFAPSFNFYPAHDSMNWLTHYFYVFYNEYYTNGQLALWLPYDLLGSETDYYIVAVMSPAQFFAAFAGKLFAVKNALTVLKASLVVEQLAFVTGMYLLSLRLFKHRFSVIFVCIGAVFTIFWGTNFGFNFRFYYLMPFVLIFLINLFDTGHVKYLWMAGIAAVVSLFGNAPYYIPIYLLIYSAFFIVLLITRRKEVKFDRKGFFSISSLVFFASFAALAFIYANLLKHVFDYTSVYSTSRVGSGGVSLENFLKHGSLMKDGAAVAGSGLDSLWQFIYACPRTYDFTIYIGLIPIVFLVYGLLHSDRDPQFKAISMVGLLVLLLSLGEISFVASVLYLFFPLMSFYRHISYLSIIAKVLFLLMAGFGVDRYLSNTETGEKFSSPAFIGGVLAALILVTDIFIFKGEFGYARDSGDIISYRFHFIPLFTLIFMALYMLRTGLKEKAAGLVVFLYFFEIASYGTALFLGMPVKEPPGQADASFEAARYAFQGERYGLETIYRLRPYMKNAMNYTNINKTPLQYSAFYVDPCPGEIFKDTNVRVDSVSSSTAEFFKARFGSDMIGRLTDRSVSGEALGDVLNDRAFLRSMGCGSPKLMIVSAPRTASDMGHAISMVRESKDLDINPIIIREGELGTEKEGVKAERKVRAESKAASGTEDEGWYRLSFIQKIGNTEYPFWESNGEALGWLLIKEKQEVTLTDYELAADFEPNITDRMFADWVLRGSKDAKTWVELDRRANEGDWRPGEERSYKIAKPNPFRFYRLDIERTNNYGTLMRVGSMKIRLKKPVDSGSFTITAFNAGFKAQALPMKKIEPLSQFPDGKILSASLTANTLNIVADADLKDSWLVYIDNYHPGWRATVNGRETPVERANIAFKAVKLDQGKNEIRFVFAGNHNTGLYEKFFFIFGIISSLYLIAISLSCATEKPGLAVSPAVSVGVLAFFVCLPLFVFDFGLHNDYSFLVAEKPGRLSFTNILFGFRDENPHLIMVGRPINAFLMGLLAVTLNGVKDLSVMRFVSFLVTFAAGGLTFTFLKKRLSLHPFWAVSAAFGIFALPSSQVYIIWVTNLIPGSLTVLVVCVSYLVFDRAFDEFKRFYHRPLLFLGAFLLLLGAFLIYPPNALFFLVFTTAKILFSKLSEWPVTRRRITIDVLFCGFTTIFYFVFVKFVLGPVSLRVYPEMRGLMIEPQRYALSISNDLAYKAVQFYNISMISFGAWFHAQFDEKIAYPVFLALAGGTLVILANTLLARKRQVADGAENSGTVHIGWIIQIVVAVLFVSLLSISPVLAAKGSFISYRLLYPYCAIVVLFVFWVLANLTAYAFKGGRGLERAVAAIATLMILLAASLAASNLYASAFSAKKELGFFREKVLNEMPWNTVRISIIKPPWGSSFVEPVLKHEFNYMASNYNDTPAVDVVIKKELGLSRTIGVAPLGDRFLMNDLYKDPYKEFRMNQSFRVMAIEDSNFVIDMNEIANSRVKGKYRPQIVRSGGHRTAEGKKDFDLVREGYKGFDIVKSKGKLYATLESEGVFKEERMDSGLYSIVVQDKSLKGLMGKIDNDPDVRKHYPDAPVSILVEEGYNGFNIISFDSKFYAILQGEGAFDFEKVKGGGYSRLFLGNRPEDVRTQIDSLPKERFTSRLWRLWHKILTK